jgi:hypothetical protein
VTLLALKLALAPLLIAAISLAAQRLGPRLAGALTAIPVVAGPLALVVALEQGPAFAARAAGATLAGELSLGVFCVIYAFLCLRAPWWLCLALGWAGFATSTLALDRLDPSLPAAFVLSLATPLGIRRLTPAPELPPLAGSISRAELAIRMAAGAALVLAISGAARALGPRLSGLLTLFPVAVTVLAVFSHRGQGAPFAVHLLRGLAAGLYNLTAFFTTLALTLEPLGVAGSFALALAASVLVQLTVLRVLRR